MNGRSPERRFTVATVRIWGGLLVWAAYFVLVYGAAAVACERGFAAVRIAGLEVTTLVTLAGLVLSLVAIGALLATTRRGARAESARGARFADRLGWTLGLLGLLALVWTALPPLLLHTGCA